MSNRNKMRGHLKNTKSNKESDPSHRFATINRNDTVEYVKNTQIRSSQYVQAFPWNITNNSKRWTQICSQSYRNVKDIINLVTFFNSAARKNNFSNLYKLSKTRDFDECLKSVYELIQNARNVLGGKRIPYLTKYGTYTFSAYQAACILAIAFVGGWPNRNSSNVMDDFTFIWLFERNRNSKINNNKMAKLMAILLYFNAANEVKEFENRLISVTRTKNGKKIDWSRNRTSFLMQTFVHHNNCHIEDFPCHEYALVDFANKHLGGGTLSNGFVQEEILFITHPECLLSRFCCAPMSSEDAVIINGPKRFTEFDQKGMVIVLKENPQFFVKIKNNVEPRHHVRQVICIDATDYQRNRSTQYARHSIEKELNKAYAGFGAESQFMDDLHNRIATGNWGSGVFGGDAKLKFVIQVIAAGLAKKHLNYCPFGNTDVKRFGDRFSMILCKKYFKVCEFN